MNAKADHFSQRKTDPDGSDAGDRSRNVDASDEPDRRPQSALEGDAVGLDRDRSRSAVPALEIDMALETPDADPPFDGWAQPLLARLIRLLGWTQGELSLAIVGDATMADLHQRYKNVPGTTDVLTFDLREPQDVGVAAGQTSFDPPLEAELVLCIDEAARQAAGRDHPVRAELLLYAVHGLLHLAGHDDHEPAAAAAMHEREDQLLAVLGLPALYRRPPIDPDESDL